MTESRLYLIYSVRAGSRDYASGTTALSAVLNIEANAGLHKRRLGNKRKDGPCL